MSINLTKGGRINLAKEAPGLNKVGIGLGWDTNQYAGAQYDLDTSVFMLTGKGKLMADDYFVFYNNLRSPDGSVQHKGDNRSGAGDSDDETIEINLDRINGDITEILFVTTLHEADIRRQNFGQVRNAYIRIYDMNTNREIAIYDLDEDFSTETAVEFGKLYKQDNQWRFMAVGQGSANGLQGFVDRYA